MENPEFDEIERAKKDALRVIDETLEKGLAETENAIRVNQITLLRKTIEKLNSRKTSTENNQDIENQFKKTIIEQIEKQISSNEHELEALTGTQK